VRDLPVPDSALDRDALHRELEELRSRPAPHDPSSLGCTVAIVAIIGLVLMPVLTRAVDWPSAAFFWLGVGLLVTALVGGALGIFGGGFARGELIGEVEEAIDELSRIYPEADPARLRACALRILDGWIVSYGPTSTTAIDREAVAERLGEAVEYLVAAERVLLESEAVYPCFTASEDRPAV